MSTADTQVQVNPDRPKGFATLSPATGRMMVFLLDNTLRSRNNAKMYPTPEQTLKAHQKASAQLMREIGDDATKARAYLVKIGILEKNKQARHGVQLAKAYQSKGD